MNHHPPAWPAVVCLGEVLTDFVATDDTESIAHATDFRRGAGGAPANVAVGLARLGTHVAFIGKVAADAFGQTLRETLAAEQVDVRNMVVEPDGRTALAFVGTDGHSGRSFVFYHHGMAHTLLRAEEVDLDLVANARVFHFGSVTLAAEPSRTATVAAARHARHSGCALSFDPNVRLEVWASPGHARSTILDMLGLVDVVKVSSDELDFLTGTSQPAEACRLLRERGPATAIVTLGGGGCYYQSAHSAGVVAGVAVHVVDTLGAGDAFMAGFLACLSTYPDLSLVEDQAALVEALRFANAVGAVSTTCYGAMSALPTRAQVDALLASSGRS